MASRGVNKVILVGNLGNDPETRFFPDGGAVTNASIATSETWKDKQTGQMQEKTEWHRVVFRDQSDELLCVAVQLPPRSDCRRVSEKGLQGICGGPLTDA